MTKPITPEELTKRPIPDFVFEAFNELIQRGWRGDEATVRLSDVKALILQKGNLDEDAEGLPLRMGWLDIEDIYREAGWEVSYEQPDYTENFPSYFTFRRKSVRS